jgi:hypothetical protein
MVVSKSDKVLGGLNTTGPVSWPKHTKKCVVGNFCFRFGKNVKAWRVGYVNDVAPSHARHVLGESMEINCLVCG